MKLTPYWAGVVLLSACSATTVAPGVDFEVAWASKVLVAVDGMNIPVLSRSLLVQNKKATGRPQDLADVARLEQAE